MNPQFWHERWSLNEIGFHQADIHPFLLEFWAGIAPSAGQVFVPLCGKTLDMLWLKQQGHTVLGVELSPLACAAFFEEQAIPYALSADAQFQRYQGADIELLCGDFFVLGSEELGDVQAVYDRAALIALPPEMQARYARHLLDNLPHRPPMLLITFEYDQGEMDGPPFSISEETVRVLFGADYGIQRLTERDLLEEQPALKNRGLSQLLEVAYYLKAL